MPLSEYARHLLAIAQTIYRWAGQISALDAARREKVALYAEEIAATLAPPRRLSRLTLNQLKRHTYCPQPASWAESPATSIRSSPRSLTILTGESSLALKGALNI